MPVIQPRQLSSPLAAKLSEQHVLGVGVIHGQQGAGGHRLNGPEFQVGHVEKYVRVARVREQAAEPRVVQVDARGHLHRMQAPLTQRVAGHLGDAQAAIEGDARLDPFA